MGCCNAYILAPGANGETLTLSDATPLIESGAGDPGVATAASRSDHVHPAVPAEDRVIQIAVADPLGDVVATGDGQAYALIPTALNGYLITEVAAAVSTASSSGLPTVQVARIRAATPADVLSTKVTIDATEYTSYTATTAPVIDAANDDLATGDFLRVDVDVAGTDTKGLIVTVTASAP